MRGARRWGGGGGFNVVLRDHTALLSSRCAASDLLHPDVPAAYCLGMGKKNKTHKRTAGFGGGGYVRVGGKQQRPCFKKAFVKRELVFFFVFFKVQFLLFLLKVFCSGGKVHIKQITRVHVVVFFHFFFVLNCAYEKSSG